jgi:hypothetical protein
MKYYFYLLPSLPDGRIDAEVDAATAVATAAVFTNDPTRG